MKLHNSHIAEPLSCKAALSASPQSCVASAARRKMVMVETVMKGGEDSRPW